MDKNECESWRAELAAAGRATPPKFEIDASTRRVFAHRVALPPCLPDSQCEPTIFTFGTLPMRPFTGGHTWFNQNVQVDA